MIDIRLLEPGDARVLSRVAPGVFDNPVDPHLSVAFLTDRHNHLAVALDGDTVIGMASAIDYVHPDKPVQMWINEVGVAPSHQRRGIARRLVSALLEHAHVLGCTEVWVATEHDNEPAQKLYAALDGKRAPVVMYAFELHEDHSGSV